MNKILITAFILGLATSAFAQTASTSYDHCTASSSRAEVAAEVASARADGTLPPAGEAIAIQDGLASHESRADVQAGMAVARADHTLAPAGEVAPLAEGHAASQESRADVAAEVAEARSEGTLPATGDTGVLTGMGGTDIAESCAVPAARKG